MNADKSENGQMAYSRVLIEWAFREWYTDYLLHPDQYVAPNLDAPDVEEEAAYVATEVTDHLISLMDRLAES